MHNVNLDAVEESAARAGSEPEALRQHVELAGDWQTQEGAAQFRASIPYPLGEIEFSADFPPPLGGTGSAPSPLAYCFWGGLACYAMTFATEAARAGVELKALHGTVETDVDLTRSLGVGDNPPVEEIRWTLEVEADAPAEVIDRLKRQADERCPGVYCIRNPIALETRVAMGGFA
jgi:uncharacterized OsmC-like protein